MKVAGQVQTSFLQAHTGDISTYLEANSADVDIGDVDENDNQLNLFICNGYVGGWCQTNVPSNSGIYTSSGAFADSVTNTLDDGAGNMTAQGEMTAANFVANSTTATSTFAGDVTMGTGITPSFLVNYNGTVDVATTSTTGALNIGNDPGSATTTIEMGKLQFDGYNSAGSRVCAEVVLTTFVVTSGKCNP